MHLMRKLPFLTINGFDQSWVASWVSFHIPQSHCHHRQHLEQAFKIHIWFSETSPVLRMPSSRNFEVQAKAICREAGCSCFRLLQAHCEARKTEITQKAKQVFGTCRLQRLNPQGQFQRVKHYVPFNMQSWKTSYLWLSTACTFSGKACAHAQTVASLESSMFAIKHAQQNSNTSRKSKSFSISFKDRTFCGLQLPLP